MKKAKVKKRISLVLGNQKRHSRAKGSNLHFRQGDFFGLTATHSEAHMGKAVRRRTGRGKELLGGKGAEWENNERMAPAPPFYLFAGAKVCVVRVGEGRYQKHWVKNTNCHWFISGFLLL